jgi:hypothetical protein
MIEPNIFGVGLDDNLDLNTAEALGFTRVDPSQVNPYIIPDDEEYLSFLKNKNLAIA